MLIGLWLLWATALIYFPPFLINFHLFYDKIILIYDVSVHKMVVCVMRR